MWPLLRTYCSDTLGFSVSSISHPAPHPPLPRVQEPSFLTESSPLTPRSAGGQVVGPSDPEAGSGGAGVPVPVEVARSSCSISMVCRGPGDWGCQGGCWIEKREWGLRPCCLLPQMRTVTRVSIRKAPCRRELNPALGAPPSPAVLYHLLDHRKGSRRKLSLHSWVRREVGLGIPKSTPSEKCPPGSGRQKLIFLPLPRATAPQ